MKKIRFNVLEKEQMLTSKQMKNLQGGSSYGCCSDNCNGNEPCTSNGKSGTCKKLNFGNCECET